MHLTKKLKLLNQNPSVSMVTIETLEEEDDNAININKLKFNNTYNRKPNFLKLEEPQTISPNSFDGSSIYEWNLDGLSVGQKMQILQKNANVC